MACNIALDAVRTVEHEENGRKEIDIKNYAKVEKVGHSLKIYAYRAYSCLVLLCIYVQFWSWMFVNRSLW